MFFKNVRNVSCSDILVHSMIPIQRNTNKQEPHHTITYLGKVKWFLSYLRAKAMEFVRGFLKIKVKTVK